jgi:limonene-1,2-epoxide hydrolase
MNRTGESSVDHQVTLQRRSFFWTALGAAGILSSAGRANAAQTNDLEKANMKIVTDFCAMASTRDVARVLPFFAPDIVYRMTETTPPVIGQDALRATAEKMFQTAERVEFKVLETFALGPIVINHRIDHFATRQPMTWEGVGVFFLKDGKIKEWSDYTIKLER